MLNISFLGNYLPYVYTLCLLDNTLTAAAKIVADTYTRNVYTMCAVELNEVFQIAERLFRTLRDLKYVFADVRYDPRMTNTEKLAFLENLLNQIIDETTAVKAHLFENDQ